MKRFLGAMIYLAVAALVFGETNAPEPALTADQVARGQFEMGAQFLNDKKYLSASDAFEKAAQAAPKFFEAYVNWGIAQVQLGKESNTPQVQLQRFRIASEKFRKAAEINPKSKLVQMLWSETLVLTGDLPLDGQAKLTYYMDALEKCRTVAAIAPDDWETYNKWGVILTAKLIAYAQDPETRRKLYGEAAGLFEKAADRARFSSDLGSVYANWGGALTEMARLSTDARAKRQALESAVDKFEKSARAIATAPSTYAMWGSALMETGKLSGMRTDMRSAIDKLKTALQYRANDPGALYNLACAYALTDNSLLAVQTLKECFQADSSDFYISQAYRDEDLKSLRGYPDFENLFGAAGRSYQPPTTTSPR